MKFPKKIAYALGLAAALSCAENPTEPPRQNNPSQPTQQNRAPRINSSPIISINENSFYEYRVQATDPDGDVLNYSIQGPSWLQVSHNVVFGNSPNLQSTSIVPVTLRVSDGKISTDQVYNLTVQNVFNSYTVSASGTNPLTNVQGNSLTFSQPVSFNIGDVVASGTNPLTPNGTLREITSISSDRKTVNTQQAPLEKIISDGQISINGLVSSSNLQSSSSLQGVSLTSSQAPSFGLNLNNVVLYDHDRNATTTNDRLVLNGRVDFESVFDFAADVDGLKLKSLDFQNTSSISSDITISSTITGASTSNIEVPLGEYYFTPITVPSPIGGLPIVVVPKVGFYVGMDPTHISPISVRVKQESSLETRLAFDAIWIPNSHFSNNFEFSNPVSTGQWDLDVYVEPRLTLLFGGVLGTSVGIGADLRLDSQGFGDWKLYGGLEAGIGFSMEVFSKTLASYSKNIIDFEKLLAQNGARPITTDTIQPGPEGKDAYVRRTRYPDSSYGYNADGNAIFLDVSNTSSLNTSESEALIQFPLSSIPPRSNITSAKLMLYGQGAFLNETARVSVSKVTNPWEETTVSWLTKPLYTNSYSTSTLPGATGWNEWDITSLVQEWVNGDVNYGLAVTSDRQRPTGVNGFRSGDNTHADQRPKLIISYN